jgi:predicted anti-sigma-YlaC factor YlaD
MTTCPEVQDRLEEYLAGTLGDAQRAEVEAHLAGCAACAADYQAARALAPLVGALPRVREPAPELWDGIARRLEAGPARYGRFVAAPAWALAAGLLLALGVGATAGWVATRRPAGRSAPESGFVATEIQYTRSIADLAALYARQRDSLPAPTRALVERNLAIIERAIREARTALEREPANRMLEALVITAYQRKLEFLEQAAGLNRAG